MMIYTGSKALQYLSIPLFTVFKNLTIVIIAYGELLFFGGSKVSGISLLYSPRPHAYRLFTYDRIFSHSRIL
jgi:hypothetical protein